MRNTGEIRIGKIGSSKQDTLVNSLGNLESVERESVKQALKELERMLAEISKK
jgi:hypothetical protein